MQRMKIARDVRKLASDILIIAFPLPKRKREKIYKAALTMQLLFNENKELKRQKHK